MKKCPFCNAQIEENARFCLYCMTSFEEKRGVSAAKSAGKAMPVIIAAVVALMLLIVALFAFCGKGDTTKGADLSNKTSSIDEQGATSSTDQKDTVTDQKAESSSSSEVGSASSGASASDLVTSVQASASSKAPSAQPGSSKAPSAQASSSKAPSNQAAASSKQPSAAPSSVAPTTTKTVYTYRDATTADDYMSSPSITANAVVITGVETVAADGIYTIPDKIDGKNVVAIASYAFCDDKIKNTVKQIIIPATVRNIHVYAFYKCYNLTDIYIKGESVACPNEFLPEKSKRNYAITIHCSATCNDRNFNTYKTLCTYLGATYKEWNG